MTDLGSGSVGLVTVTYNSGVVLQDFLESVVHQEGVRFTLYAVDNASVDDTLDILARYADRLDLRVMPNAENLGIAVGNNQGTVAALADGAAWILFVNNDTVLEPHAVASLVHDAETNGLDLLSPLIEATDPAGSVWYAGGDIVRWQGMKPTHALAGEPMSRAPRELMPVAYASTCCLLVRPRVFEAIGLMDPVYFVYYDDIDFAIRAVDAGFQFWLTPSTIVLHKASSLTGGPESPFFIRWRSRNWVLIARKHLDPPSRLVALTYIQVWMLARLVVRRDSLSVWKLRQRSFLEGLRVAIGSSAPPLADAGPA